MRGGAFRRDGSARCRVRPIAGLLACALVLTAVAPSGAAAAPSPSRPNIVLVLVDDLDLVSYLDATRFPRFDHLMTRRGTTFSRYFVTDSLCCPSRASTLRSQLVHSHGTLGNEPPSGGFVRFRALGNEHSTIATWLQQAGYRTALVGKYLNGYPAGAGPAYQPPGWDHWVSPVAGNPYGEFDYTLDVDGRLVRYGNAPRDYLVDVLRRRSVHFVERAARRGPFFLYVTPFVPHQPATPAPRDAARFPNARAPRTRSFDQRDLSAEPPWLRDRVPLDRGVLGYTDNLYRRRLQDMLAVDDLLDRLIAALRRTGTLDNTYLLFASDNGFHLGQHRLPPGKQTPFEEDIHVPLVVRGPGVPAGRTARALTANIDLAPTIAALAGAAAPDFVEGRSLVPLLHGASTPSPWRRLVLVEHYQLTGDGRDRVLPLDAYAPGARRAPSEPDADGRWLAAALRARTGAGGGGGVTEPTDYVFPVPTYAAIRTRRWLYAEYADGGRQLYDLRADPDELHNLALHADPALLDRLHATLDRMRSCRAASCRKIEEAGVRPLVTGSRHDSQTPAG
jgi:N-acetylglucosamine-6-sulfatase